MYCKFDRIEARSLLAFQSENFSDCSVVDETLFLSNFYNLWVFSFSFDEWFIWTQAGSQLYIYINLKLIEEYSAHTYQLINNRA